MNQNQLLSTTATTNPIAISTTDTTNQTAISTAATTNPKNYNVYLSFCDEDTGSFAFHLYTALTSEYGIVVFWDLLLGSGDREIPSSSLNVIGECEVVVIVISTKYLHSLWCCHEFNKITECCRIIDGVTVLPLFYDGVYPCKGRLKRDMFGGYVFHDFVDDISMMAETSEMSKISAKTSKMQKIAAKTLKMAETSREKDTFMSWVEAVSTKAFKYSDQDIQCSQPFTGNFKVETCMIEF